jgi:ferredoxin--NADP+ reductase
LNKKLYSLSQFLNVEGGKKVAKILKKEVLTPQIKLMVIDAPWVAHKAKPGQFVVLRIAEQGERIPLTVADFDSQKGTVTIIFQEVGKTTMMLGDLEEGDEILDL